MIGVLGFDVLGDALFATASWRLVSWALAFSTVVPYLHRSHYAAERLGRNASAGLFLKENLAPPSTPLPASRRNLSDEH